MNTKEPIDLVIQKTITVIENASPKVWNALVAAERTDAISDIIGFLILIVFFTWFGVKCYQKRAKHLKKYKEDYPHSDASNEAAGTFILCMIPFIPVAICMAYMPGDIVRVIYPDVFVVQNLLDQALSR